MDCNKTFVSDAVWWARSGYNVSAREGYMRTSEGDIEWVVSDL